MGSSEYVIVLTTMPAGSEAVRLAKILVEERLAACVNVQNEMQSVYRWKGKTEQDSEQQLVIKTMSERVPALRKRIRSLHPYEGPEFVVIKLSDGDKDYLSWLKDAVSKE